MEVCKFKVGDFVRVKGTPSKNDDGRFCILSGVVCKVSYVPQTNPNQPRVGYVIDITTDEETRDYFRSGESNHKVGPSTLTFVEDDLEFDLGKNREQILNSLGIKDGNN